MNQLGLLEPVVINIRHVPNHERDTIYIGRGGPYGNPFVIGRDGTRDEVIAKFEVMARHNPPLLKKIRALSANAILKCYCKPEACHGDVIVKLWKEMNHAQDK